MDKSEGYFELSCDIRIVLTNEETEIKKNWGKGGRQVPLLSQKEVSKESILVVHRKNQGRDVYQGEINC
jgi:hypothetical protein